MAPVGPARTLADDTALTPPPPPGWWRCRALDSDGRPLWMAIVSSGLHPDGEVVEMPHARAADVVGEDIVAVAHFGAGGEVVRVTADRASDKQPLAVWFVEVPEPDGTPPASALVAFTGHGVEEGTLVDRDALLSLGVTSDEQVGAVRWYPATGEVDQVYVAPSARRQGVGSVLVVGGSLLNQARGLPRWWGDGQRTADGDRWRNASPWAQRAADLTHLAPPMTPFDER